MLVGSSDCVLDTNHVKFISYTGKYPTLCSGLLTLEIDGETVVFGYDTQARLLKQNMPMYPPFWSSGGSTDWHLNIVRKGEWKIQIGELPDKFRKYAKEIDTVFNANVPHGCCGGCL